MYEFEDMVAIAQLWLNKESKINKQQFLDTPRDKLVKYHTTLGRTIRNEFKLWDTVWLADIREGVDCSPDHPDQVSMRVIETVWERLHSS